MEFSNYPAKGKGPWMSDLIFEVSGRTGLHMGSLDRPPWFRTRPRPIQPAHAIVLRDPKVATVECGLHAFGEKAPLHEKLPLALAIGFACLLFAGEKVDEATDARIRSEEMEHSQLMRTLHMLADRYGPRVTGTPNHEEAAKWVVNESTRWGMKNAHLGPWDFGRPGWLNEWASGFMVAPVRQNLKFEVLAWTPSTQGTVTAAAVQHAGTHLEEMNHATSSLELGG